MSKSIPLSQGKVAVVDDADYDHLVIYQWFLSGTGYAVGFVPNGDGRFRLEYMHRFIMQAAAKLITRAVILAACIALLGPVFQSHGQSWTSMASLLDNPFLLIKVVTGIAFSLAGVLLLQAVAHEVGVRTLDDTTVTPEELLAKLREERRQKEEAIYDRILDEHLERKPAALAERRQRMPEWPEIDLSDEIPGRNGRHAADWDA